MECSLLCHQRSSEGKVVRVLFFNWALRQRILDLGSRWRWAVSFTSRPLYPQEKSPWYPLDRSLGEHGPQRRSRRSGEEENSQGVKPLTVRNIVTCYEWNWSSRSKNWRDAKLVKDATKKNFFFSDGRKWNSGTGALKLRGITLKSNVSFVSVCVQ
jgi:hypothetical protein